MRQRGSRNTLVKVDYDLIGRLAAISGDTARQYAHRHEYDPRDLDSVLRWVNKRRQLKGQPMIGGHTSNLLEADESEVVNRSAAPPSNLADGFDCCKSVTDAVTGHTAST